MSFDTLKSIEIYVGTEYKFCLTIKLNNIIISNNRTLSVKKAHAKVSITARVSDYT